LRIFLDKYKIDIALIQESKLTEGKASPRIKGYATVRGDRRGAKFPGGGLSRSSRRRSSSERMATPNGME